MIESSRRKILDTLNSRYLYKRVVCSLVYNTATYISSFLRLLHRGRGKAQHLVAFVQIATIQFWDYDRVDNTLTSLPSIAITPYDCLSLPDCSHVETGNEI